ncbi:eukaryotic protein [Schizosaccharomyces cryophilus OY26]|uniref:Eukaryotic protein n=1 Tax=Schizosaccharomyces cryophilus (strain OY26 / ATCC MYA-4695 / CBS 11777 / NBRC 106824 / NRRL Y48691) TaxID=653667 RepID=S9WWS3_SCHCR|nr:uncharacterized protein SPOG_04453 [Schizosaccharomyces cryophilus OY26]EPY49192.1 eukaryotic protein [Schizosaccharomyces cryophilus OY26]
MYDSHQEEKLQALLAVIRGLNYILDDKMDEAIKIFNSGNTSFHLSGQAVVSFLQAVLTFEPSRFGESQNKIDIAIKALTEDKDYASKNDLYLCTFDPGIEYRVSIGLMLLLSALIGFCSESIVTSVKSVYKLRKAHNIFNKINKRHFEAFSTSFQTTNNKDIDTVNEYVQTGTLLCTGLFTLLISLLPPKMITILSLLGYKGDRDMALSYMWMSALQRPSSFFAAVAFAALIQYYSGAVQLCSIYKVTPTEPDGWPVQRCFDILSKIRVTHPEGPMWPLHEAKLLSMVKKQSEAIDVLNDLMSKPPPKLMQLEVLIVFEHALDCAFSHRYVDSAHSFLKLSSLNDSSTGLYSYFAAACFLQDVQANANVEALENASKLLEPLGNLLVDKTAPLDIHIRRKVKKLADRRASVGNQGGLAEYVGFSPLYQLVYVWNGFRRMNAEELSRFDVERVQPWQDQDDDICQALVKATLWRNTGKLDESIKVLQKICQVTKTTECWAVAFAHYEMAVALFETDSTSKNSLKECDSYLKAARDFGGDNEFESRLIIRVQLARHVVRQCLQEGG